MAQQGGPYVVGDTHKDPLHGIRQPVDSRHGRSVLLNGNLRKGKSTVAFKRHVFHSFYARQTAGGGTGGRRRGPIRRASALRASAMERALACARRSSLVNSRLVPAAGSAAAESLCAHKVGPSWMPIWFARNNAKSAVTTK